MGALLLGVERQQECSLTVTGTATALTRNTSFALATMASAPAEIAPPVEKAAMTFPFMNGCASASCIEQE